jgi:hypothetical protein
MKLKKSDILSLKSIGLYTCGFAAYGAAICLAAYVAIASFAAISPTTALQKNHKLAALQSDGSLFIALSAAGVLSSPLFSAGGWLLRKRNATEVLAFEAACEESNSELFSLRKETPDSSQS